MSGPTPPEWPPPEQPSDAGPTPPAWPEQPPPAAPPQPDYAAPQPDYGPPQPGYGYPQQAPAAYPGYPAQPGYGPPEPGYGAPPGYPQQGQPYPQPGYGYGQPTAGYGYPAQPPAMGPLTSQFARIDPGPSQGFGVAGALVAAVGAALVIVAFTAVDWFTHTGDSHSKFGDVHDLLSSAGRYATGPAKAYFSWLGWTLLIVALLSALLAVTPTVGRAFRGLTPVVAAAAVVVTFVAIKLLGGAGEVGITETYGDYLDHARTGFYLAVAGFVLIGIGGLIGPRRMRR